MSTDAKTGIEKWPAAAVIPAPIAYVKVAAVKKLVVEARRPQAVDAPRGALGFGRLTVRWRRGSRVACVPDDLP